MFHEQIGTAIASASRPAQLDQLAAALWHAYGSGAILEEQANHLSDLLQARRTVLAALAASKTADFSLGGLTARFTRTRLQRAPNRAKAIERRRRLAASGPLPPQLAAQFTTGELAVLRIIGDEVRDNGQCDRTLSEIAARAGVCRTTAQNAIRQAAQLGLVTVEERRCPGRKNLPNVIRIASREWRAWFERGPNRQNWGDGFKNLNTPDKRFSRERRAQSPDQNLGHRFAPDAPSGAHPSTPLVPF